jgi:hypothetical protein
MESRGVVISVACKLHNICINDFVPSKPHTLHRGTLSVFLNENDYQAGDSIAPPCTNGTHVVSQGYRSDLVGCDHSD